ncbi:MAG: CaiB/BaiF CoA-transferase family protein [Alphaproteobacteria bacterium]
MSTVAPGSLSGFRIIDFTTMVAGPLCAQIMGDFGADVIKVESIHGEDGRRLGAGRYRGDSTAYYAGMHRNKRTISLDLARPEGRDVMLELLKDADVLIQAVKPGTMEKWGLGYDEVLKERFPKLVVCRITGFGDKGTMGGLIGYDPLAQAYSGVLSMNGPADGDPMRLGVSAVDASTGLYAAIGVLTALHERNASGRGQLVDICLLDAAYTLMHPFTVHALMAGVRPKRMGSRHPDTVPTDLYPTLDGAVMVCILNDRQFVKLCEICGLGEIGSDPRYLTSQNRGQHAEFLFGAFRAAFAGQRKHDIAMRLLRAGVPAAPVLDVNEALAHPHVAEHEMVMEGEHGYRAIGNPIKLQRTPPRLHRVPPTLGEHSREILREIGMPEDKITALLDAGVVSAGPPVGTS